LCLIEDFKDVYKEVGILEKERILIVEDEERIREMIREYIEPEGYKIDEAADGVEALNLFKKYSYALIILDIMLPKIDGWSVCREIRKTSSVPIIMLTARGEEYDKLFGFELGVDDYMVKPFSPKELLARIKAIIRRNTPDHALKKNELSFEGLLIEENARNVYVDGVLISLTPKEYELLHFFAQNPNQVFSREQILNAVWDYDFIGDDRTVDTHIKMLRESIKQYRKFIITVWGTGYKFVVGEKR